MTDKTIWRLPKVMVHTGLSRSTIYHKISQDEFPHSINLGLRSVGWIADEVLDWIDEQIKKSRQSDQR